MVVIALVEMIVIEQAYSVRTAYWISSAKVMTSMSTQLTWILGGGDPPAILASRDACLDDERADAAAERPA